MCPIPPPWRSLRSPRIKHQKGPYARKTKILRDYLLEKHGMVFADAYLNVLGNMCSTMNHSGSTEGQLELEDLYNECKLASDAAFLEDVVLTGLPFLDFPQ